MSSWLNFLSLNKLTPKEGSSIWKSFTQDEKDEFKYHQKKSKKEEQSDIKSVVDTKSNKNDHSDPFDMSALQESLSIFNEPFGNTERWLHSTEIEMIVTGFLLDKSVFYFGDMPYSKFPIFLEDPAKLSLFVGRNPIARYGVAVLNTSDRGIHWLALLIDFETRQAVVVDPLSPRKNGTDCQLKITNELVYLFNTKLNKLGYRDVYYEFTSRCLALQNDSYNCGVWVVEAIRLFIESHDLKFEFPDNFSIRKRRKFWSQQLYG